MSTTTNCSTAEAIPAHPIKLNDLLGLTTALSVANPHSDKVVLPNLDGIRGTACLLVVLSHMPLPIKFVTLGETGVGLFFVLSGFLMSYLYGRAKWDLAATCEYGIARFSRIAPIYWAVISLCILISHLEPNTVFELKILGFTSILRHYFFVGNVSIFWSIPPEIQYYIFFITIWWGISLRYKLTYTVPLLALICAGLILTHNLWPGLSLPRYLHFFIAGTIAGLAPRSEWQTNVEKRVLMILQIFAAFLISIPLWLYSSKAEFYKATELALAFGVAIYLLSISSNWTNFIFASRLMREIGQASFSIYLLHLVVFHFGMKPLGLIRDQYNNLWIALGLLGIVLSIIVSKYIEIPLQKVTRIFLQGRLEYWSLKTKLRPQ
jgi:peptidoglycan/LPS O-acetylase OafA/YrhL